MNVYRQKKYLQVLYIAIIGLVISSGQVYAENDGVQLSISCTNNADCGNAIFGCEIGAGQTTGQCVQIESCTTSIQCIEALGSNTAECSAGRCQIFDPNSAGTSGATSGGSGTAGNGTTIGCPEGQDCVSLTNPLGTTNIPEIIGKGVGVVMGLVGTIAFVVFVYGGFNWLTSAGNSEKIQKGMQAMLWAGIGIIVVFSSYAILTLILKTLEVSP